MFISLAGQWETRLEDGTEGVTVLPGTLDESGIGHRDSGANQWHPDAELGNAAEDFDADAPIATRFTRLHTFEGESRFRRRVLFEFPEGKRVFLKVERARVLRLFIDGKEMPLWKPGSLSTPWIYEVTEVPAGEHEIELGSDNSYPGLPHDSITYSSAATDETQTNWNGILGEFGLYTEEPVFLSELGVLPEKADGELTLELRIELDADRPFKGQLQIESPALKETVELPVEMTEAGRKEIVLEKLALREDCRLWEEGEGFLYELRARLGDEVKTVSFGLRTFGDNGRGRLALNGRTIFLRSEANCAEFPETGHAPMTVEEWEEILKRYESYGINCMRFHSHCPPEAAFTAADRLGMLMQPELSHWNPKDAFETEESYAYYRTELICILKMLRNHPSFVMLTLGNELQSQETGHKRMSLLLELARSMDGTRLYANGSNVHYGEQGCDSDSDFYASQSCYKARIRGTFSGMEGYINHQYPNAKTNYDKDMAMIRESYQKPVFSFEVGQYEVLPDFKELALFHGISDPANLRLIQDKVRAMGLEEVWEQYVEASGELSRLAYREEVEAAMRTRELSGISLLGLQDFPGQGTALVGMMNSHLQPKPYEFARPERFREFFRDCLPLVLLEKYTYEAGETLRAQVLVANFGRKELAGELKAVLRRKSGKGGGSGEIVAEQSLGQVSCPAGEHTEAGVIELCLDFVREPSDFVLQVSAGEAENSYPVWVYPRVEPVCPAGVLEARRLDDRALEQLARGGIVYLSPKSDKETLPKSIQAQFTTDFWSVGTFSNQEGGMGQLIDAGHPLFKKFPTESHTDWQWWVFAGQRAIILPRPMKAVITEMDSYAYLRPMAQLIEFRCGGGRVLFSSLGLQDLQQYPEARALLHAVYKYLESGDFAPEQEITPEELGELVR